MNSGDEKVVLRSPTNVSSVGSVNASKYKENTPLYKNGRRNGSSIPKSNVYIRFPICEGNVFRTSVPKREQLDLFYSILKLQTSIHTRGKLNTTLK